MEQEGGAPDVPTPTVAQARKPVGWFRVTLLALYLLGLAAVCVCGLFTLWPGAPTDPTHENNVSLFAISFAVTDETRTLALVLVAGALGALVHAMRSLYWYVGHRELRPNWILQYLLLPVVGSTLGALVYLAVRGGLLPTQQGAAALSPLGMAAVSGVVGMFSSQAVTKRHQVADSLFSKAPRGADSVTPAKDETDQGTGTHS